MILFGTRVVRLARESPQLLCAWVSERADVPLAMRACTLSSMPARRSVRGRRSNVAIGRRSCFLEIVREGWSVLAVRGTNAALIVCWRACSCVASLAVVARLAPHHPVVLGRSVYLRQRRHFGCTIILRALSLLTLRSVTRDFMFWVGDWVRHGACCDCWEEGMARRRYREGVYMYRGRGGTADSLRSEKYLTPSLVLVYVGGRVTVVESGYAGDRRLIWHRHWRNSRGIY